MAQPFAKFISFGLLGKKKKSKKKQPVVDELPPPILFNSETEGQETLARKTVLGGF